MRFLLLSENNWNWRVTSVLRYIRRLCRQYSYIGSCMDGIILRNFNATSIQGLQCPPRASLALPAGSADALRPTFRCVGCSYNLIRSLRNNASLVRDRPLYSSSPKYMAVSRFVPSQWETALLCNAVSHWLVASLQVLAWTSAPGQCKDWLNLPPLRGITMTWEFCVDKQLVRSPVCLPCLVYHTLRK